MPWLWLCRAHRNFGNHPITPKVSDMLSKGEITPYELELQIQEEGVLPNLRISGLKLLREGKTDLAAISKMIDMSTDD